MIKVAVLSFWHVHANGYASHLKSRDDVDIAAVWDDDPTRGKVGADRFGAAFEPDLEKLLSREDIDGVCVTSATSLHADIMVAAADAGKHIFTEKVMAITVDECRRIAEAVERAGVKFCISMPRLASPQVLFAKQAIDNKWIGDVTLARVRAAHRGALDGLPERFFDPDEAGGGAMIDLGAHPMYTLRWLLGRPKRVTSTFTSITNRPVEDNAVSVIEFDSRAIGIAEAGFVSTGGAPQLEVYGTEGTIVVEEGGTLRVLSRNVESPLTASGPTNAWIVPTRLPGALPAPIEQWARAILEGGDVPYGTREGTWLTELMEAAYRSHREGRTVEAVGIPL